MFFHAIWSGIKYYWWKWVGWETLVPPKTMGHRHGECDVCPHNQDGTCGICKCLIMSKTILASESCPRGFWPAVRIKKVVTKS